MAQSAAQNDPKNYRIPTSSVCSYGRFARTSAMAGQNVLNVSAIEQRLRKEELGLGMLGLD